MENSLDQAGMEIRNAWRRMMVVIDIKSLIPSTLAAFNCRPARKE